MPYDGVSGKGLPLALAVYGGPSRVKPGRVIEGRTRGRGNEEGEAK